MKHAKLTPVFVLSSMSVSVSVSVFGVSPTDMLLGSKVIDEDNPAATPTGMTDEQLYDELKTMLLAGHETSSMALTWAL